MLNAKDYGLYALTLEESEKLLLISDPDNETVLLNGVTIYSTGNVAKAFVDLITRYSRLFTDKGGVVKIPKADYMTIPLRED